MFTVRKSWMLSTAAVVGTALWFALLAGRPLFDPDEGRYAEIPREILSGGDWVIPHLNALVYLEKPPLQYWLTALAFRSFGQNEFTARLCTGVAGYLSLVVVFFVARKLWGVEAGLKALLLTSASFLFVLLGHQLTLDMLLSFWLLAVLSCFFMAQTEAEDARGGRFWMLGCWAAMALATLTKGLIGILIPVATLGVYVVWQGDWTVLRRLNLRWGIPLFIMIATPWFVLAARANSQFLKFFFIREHFQRFLTPIEHRTEPWWFFVPVLLIGVMPWLPHAVGALVSPFNDRTPRGQFNGPRLLWIWCILVLVFFSFSDSKLIPYILPAIPALALLCASLKGGNSRRNLLLAALLSIAACIAILTYLSGFGSSAESRKLIMLIRPTLFWTCAALTLGAAVCAVCALRGQPLAALAGLCGFWFLATGSVFMAANTAQALFSARDVARALQGRVSAQDMQETPLFAVQSYQQSLAFYLQRPVVLVDYRDEFDLGLTLDPGRGIRNLEEFARVWAPINRGFAVIPLGSVDHLSAMGVPMREIARFPDRVLVSRR